MICRNYECKMKLRCQFLLKNEMEDFIDLIRKDLQEAKNKLKNLAI